MTHERSMTYRFADPIRLDRSVIFTAILPRPFHAVPRHIDLNRAIVHNKLRCVRVTRRSS